MPPKKGTKAYREEYTDVVFGIGHRTKEVRSIWVQRNGFMTGDGPDGTTIRHFAAPGRAEHEAVIVSGLTDVFSTPVNLVDSAITKVRIAELRGKAAQMKASEDAAEKED